MALDGLEFDNYRPISIIAAIAKVFETLLATKMTDYLESNGLLHSAQFGFRKFLSCEHAVTAMLESIRN
jgi:hypothetical protein